MASVTIVNLSTHALVVGGVNVVVDFGTDIPLVRLIPNRGSGTGFKQNGTLQFDPRRGVGTAAYVDIEQRSPNPASGWRSPARSTTRSG